MNLTADIDIYCERLGPGLLEEPLNAVTNLAFVLAAWLCWRRYGAKRGEVDFSGAFLMVMVGVIGVGSGLFHTVATRWAMLADVIPIAIFIYGFLWFALKRFFALGEWPRLGLLIAFTAFSTQIDGIVPNEVLNGSEGYVPAFFGLLAMGVAMRMQKHKYADALLWAGLVFAISLTFRTVDMRVCATVPFGTHFLWHTINGVALYIVGRAYLKSWTPQAVGD